MLMASHSARIVRREKGDERSNVLGFQPAVDALRIDDRGLAFRSVPLHLARRTNVSRDNAIHPDIVLAEVARERPGESFDCRLAGLVKHEVRQGEVPADRSKIDDCAAPRRAHPRHHRLSAEELVLEIYRQAIVPIFLGDVRELVAIIVRGIVYEDSKWSVAFDEF